MDLVTLALTRALARKYADSSSGVPNNSPSLSPADLEAHNNATEAHPNLRELIATLQECLNGLEQESHAHDNADILNAITQTLATQLALNDLTSRIAVLEQPIPMRGAVYEALVPPTMVFNMNINYSLPSVNEVADALDWPLQIAGDPEVIRRNGIDGRGQLQVTVNENWQGVDILHGVLNATYNIGDRLTVRGQCVEANHMILNVVNEDFRPIHWHGTWTGGEANVPTNGRFELTTGFLNAEQQNLIFANQPQGIRIRGLAESATFIIEDIIWERPQNRTMLQLLGILASQVV